MKKFLFVVAVLFAGYSYFSGPHSATPNNSSTAAQSQSVDTSDAVIANAFANQISNLQVSGQGVVIKLLPDDNSGSRHQRFIVKLANGQTLLVAHNIDLAARVAHLSEGDSIMFNGQYEWNQKGGVLHWTHRDPSGSHPAGWLQHQGQTYQ
ncbi:MAG: DUF3465 domain-containing protein [Pseudomonadota bacterium]